MRQAAEDALAQSARKETPEWKERHLRRDVERLAKKNFPAKEREHLTEVVMEAFKNGELDTGFMHDSYLRKIKGLVTRMNELRELPVAASAVKFCANLFREATRAAHAMEEADKAAGICHKVLTGELGPHDGPKWAEKAANSSQPKGQHYQLGRLEKVNATEKAWKVSLDNVCKDECIELVKEMRNETAQILKDVIYRKPKPPSYEEVRLPSYEEVCAKRVVQKVEAEILGCCAEKCGWNGRACMLWPFLNSTEKGQWEAECCTEFNILAGSSRATMCDATLTRKENEEVIRDGQPNSKEDREMIGQDPVLNDNKTNVMQKFLEFFYHLTSFLQSEDTNGPTPSPEYKPISAPKGKCPPPLDLGEVHEKLKHQWRTTDLVLAESVFEKFNKDPLCEKPPADTIGNCTAFLPEGVDGGYVCYGECLESVPVKDLPEMKTLDAKIPGNTGLLYVHEAIFNR